jgi:hypothetical protein
LFRKHLFLFLVLGYIHRNLRQTVTAFCVRTHV